MSTAYDEATVRARDYYNSGDADTFYAEVWGGEDIHIGLYASADEAIGVASRRTVDTMIDRLGDVPRSARVLDIGSGYGGAARRVVERLGCSVVCLNLSEAENERNRAFNERAGVGDRVEVLDGAFERIPLGDGSVGVVWSQDALLHSGDRERVLREVDRVLSPGGVFVFTDPMRADGAALDELQPILDRIHLSDLGSPGFYLGAAASLGWIDRGFVDRTDQLVRHYTRVLEETEAAAERLAGRVSAGYIERMKRGLGHWIEGGKAGRLAWGEFLFEKPGGAG